MSCIMYNVVEFYNGRHHHTAILCGRTPPCVVLLTPRLVVSRMVGRFAIRVNTQYVKLLCVKVICWMSHKSEVSWNSRDLNLYTLVDWCFC